MIVDASDDESKVLFYSLRNEKCPDCKYGDFFIIYYSNLKSNSRFGQLIEFYVQKCPWMLKLMKYKAAYGPIRIRHCAGPQALPPPDWDFRLHAGWGNLPHLQEIHGLVGQAGSSCPVLDWSVS